MHRLVMDDVRQVLLRILICEAMEFQLTIVGRL